MEFYALVRNQNALPSRAWPGVQVVSGDLSRPQTLAFAVDKAKPDLVVHCAGLTNVDQCEREPDLARAVNTVGSEALARAAFENQAGFVYVSTDAVYAKGPGPHPESDAGGKLSVYAESKLAAESAVIDAHPRALVLRTCMIGWNQNPGLSSLGEWIVATLRAGEQLPGFVDVRFSPLFTVTLARLMLKAAQVGIKGIYNLGSGDGLSKYKTARLFAKGLGLEPDMVKPVSQKKASLAVARPEEPVMDSSIFYDAMGAQAPTVAQEIEKMLNMQSNGELLLFRKFGGYA